MYLKAIELENFKSFGKKTVLEFKKGFTAISGPNGSGKSNITDAVLFVLGPKSSKKIRAQKLTDLIYNGGKNGRPAEYCRVSLIFENKDRILPIDEDEVKLTRYIKRANTEEGYNSYFYINGDRARLQDFASILSHAKISADGYNFVQQGDITRIVEMSPLERRTVLDDIAGITKFDQEIKKAEEKKKVTEENMSRLEVLLDEIKRRLESLARDREVALKYMELESRLKETRAKIAYANMMRYQGEKETYLKQIEEIDRSIGEIKREIDEKKGKLEKIKKQIDEIDRKIEDLGQGEMAQLKRRIDELKIKAAESRMRIENGEDRVRELEEYIREAKKEIKNLQAEIREKENLLQEKKEMATSLENKQRENIEKLKNMEEKMGEADKRFRELQREDVRLGKEMEKKRKDYAAKNEEMNRLRMQIDSLNRDIEDKEEEIKDVDLAIKDAEWRISQFKEEHSGVEKKKKRLQKEYYELQNRETALNRELQKKEEEVKELKVEYERIKARMEASEDAMSTAVMSVLAARDRGELRGIYGTIAELGNVDDKYALAIEIAAGNRLMSIVCEDDESAARAIEFLKRRKLGRAIFLPLNKMLRGRPRGKAILASRDSHAHGFAMDLIKFDPKFEAAFWYVFGDTVIVDDLNNARRLMGGVRLVTLDGQLIEASGAMVGGSVKRRARVSMGNLEEIGAKLRNAIAEKEGIARELKDVRNRIEKLLEEIRKLNMVDRTSNIEIWKKEKEKNIEKRKRLQKDVEEIKKRRNEYEEILKRVSQERDALQEKLNTLEKRESKIRTEMENLIPEKIAQEMKSLRNKIDKIGEELQTHRENIIALGEEIKTLRKRKDEKENEIVAKEERIKQLKDKIDEERDTLENYEIERRKLEEVLNKYEMKNRKLLDEREKLASQRANLSEDITRDEGTIKVKEEWKIQLNTKIMEVENRYKEAKREYEEYEIEVTKVEPLSKLRKEEENIQIEMESLGPVNMKSIDEYGMEEERYNSILEDYNKLKKERDDLVSLVKELNGKKKNGLMKVFDAINENFQKIYREISNGGEAELLLENPENPFQGGLIIRVKPVGKRFVRLESLSGGEKSLTALAFIFAIQQYDPSPIYVLDEVDMFLDGINAEIVGRVIKRNSTTAQFIVVSLRKATLKFADHIIGVTQAGDGLSRVFLQEIPREEVNASAGS